MRIADLRFLVVEDQQSQRAAVGRMLADLGAKHVYEAADGEAALAILRDDDQPVDVIVNELDMPGMDGMEFIRHVGLEKLPISMILASRLDRPLIVAVETMTTAYGVRMLGIIEKPVTPQKLEAALQPRTPAGRSRLESRPMSLEPMGETRPTFPLKEIVEGLANDQFEPFFQPKVEMEGGRIVGAKALARWRHPEMGKVEPYAFVAPLEESKRIDELTWVMLRKAAACCSAWHATQPDASVSVRLAVGSLLDAGLADRVTELVCGQDLEPAHMILEITGPASFIKSGNALENLARLRLRGFGLAVEDCGTGHSSIQQLSRIAFTELKVDRDFATNASSQESSRTLLLSMLATARSLGIASVAEGVETQADWELIRGLGCDIARGFFIAAPMDAEAYVQWARGKSHWVPRHQQEGRP